MFMWKYVAGCLALHGLGGASGTAIERRQCSNGLTPSYTAPTIAQGWNAQVVVKSLTSPRGLIFDGNGALLVVEQRKGITRLTFTGSGTCLTANKTTVVSQNDLTHGIAFSADNKTLYASSTEAVFSWAYDATTGTVGGTRSTIIANMTNNDHVTRTLTVSKQHPEILLVARGSNENMDAGTQDLSTGRSQIRAFNLSQTPAAGAGGAYDYPREGRILGWGLRNDVGVVEHPVTGGLWAVENSIDDFTRNGQNIHTDNPGEKLNYLGRLSDAVPATPPNFGYPNCVALWNNTNVPNASNVAIGTQISTGFNTSVTDQMCASSAYVGPRVIFQPHSAPLDMLISGSEAFITFHGSWDRTPPSGYRLGSIAFGADGTPTASVTSTTALTDILSPPNINNCPSQCARPVSLALDGQGRLFMSSDTTGEIWVLQRQ